MSSPYIEKLKKENFIGWRSALNGIFLDKKPNSRISKFDLHPNKLGQEVIAEYIYENL
jgi:hypothetical protein